MAFNQKLEWSNIRRDDLVQTEIWDAFVKAKEELELHMKDCAVAADMAQEGDEFKFSYRSIGQGVVGMAISAGQPSRSSGFSGLKRPTAKASLVEYQNGMDGQGYRR